jgi:hypothetical protein
MPTTPTLNELAAEFVPMAWSTQRAYDLAELVLNKYLRPLSEAAAARKTEALLDDLGLAFGTGASAFDPYGFYQAGEP